MVDSLVGISGVYVKSGHDPDDPGAESTSIRSKLEQAGQLLHVLSLLLIVERAEVSILYFSYSIRRFRIILVASSM